MLENTLFFQILRQFEALTGGFLQAPKQDTAKSSQHRTTSQFPTPVCPDPLLPVHSAHTSATFNYFQPSALSRDATQAPDLPASLSALASAQRGSSAELTNDTEDQSSIQQKPVRTSQFKPAAEGPELFRDGSGKEDEREQVSLKKPSLFSGMELVTKARPLREGKPSATESVTAGDDLKEDSDVQNPDGDEVVSVCKSVESSGNQTVSAFSFLNF